ncbi:MAG: hypothetical protein V4523_13650 [Pseudomonadota bacterium]
MTHPDSLSLAQSPLHAPICKMTIIAEQVSYGYKTAGLDIEQRIFRTD